MSVESLDPLIGRDALCDEVVGLTARSRLVTLTGSGGTGKTRLAEAVLDATRPRREAIFVDCATLTASDDFARVVAAAVGIVTRDDPETALHAWAATGERLVALDNLEQVRGVAGPVERLLGAGPDLHVLATSRAPIGAHGEYEVRVPALALPDGDSPAAVEASPAGALFLRRARAAGRLRGALDPVDAAAIAALCRRLDGLPLAIELAAARTRILAPGDLLDHLLADDHRVLRRDRDGGRHRSLAAVLDWTMGLLSDEEREVLVAVSVCAGGFGVGLAADLAADRSVSADVVAPLDALAAYGLVEVGEPVDGEPRFRLLETIRMVALDGVGDRGGDLRRRHAEAMARIVERWEPALETRDIRRALARLDGDRDNIVAAVRWADAHDPSLAIRIVAGAATYWIVRGYVLEPLGWLRALSDRVPKGSLDRAVALAAFVRLGGVAGREAETSPFAPEVIELGRKHGRQDVEMEGLYALQVHGPEAHPASATLAGEALLARAETLAGAGIRQDAIAFDLWILTTRTAGGVGAASAGIASRLDGAVADGLLRRAGHLGQILAWERLCEGRVDDAVHAAETAITAARETGDLRFEAAALQSLALAQGWLDRWPEARSSLARSLAISAALDTPATIADILQTAAVIAASRGRGLDAAWLAGAADAAFAPRATADLETDHGAISRIWKSARRQSDPVRWEVERQAGRSAGRDEALARAAHAATAALAPGLTSLPPRHGLLTPREVEILTLVAQSQSDSEIARRLGISPKTASVHVANVKAKLRAPHRVGLALMAREMGIVATSPAEGDGSRLE